MHCIPHAAPLSIPSMLHSISHIPPVITASLHSPALTQQQPVPSMLSSHPSQRHLKPITDSFSRFSHLFRFILAPLSSHLQLIPSSSHSPALSQLTPSLFRVFQSSPSLPRASILTPASPPLSHLFILLTSYSRHWRQTTKSTPQTTQLAVNHCAFSNYRKHSCWLHLSFVHSSISWSSNQVHRAPARHH